MLEKQTSAMFRTALLLLALAALALAGCEKRSKGLGDSLASVYYLKGWSYVRAEPSPQGKALAKAGPNTRVTISDTEDGWSKVSIDDGRVVGWVESAGLSEAPVKEAARRAAPKSSSAKKPAAKSSKATKSETAAPAAEMAAPEESAQADQPAEAPQNVQEEAVATAPEPAPAQDEKPALIILSPSEAEAATAPPAPPKKPARSKQAKPEAFDPF